MVVGGSILRGRTSTINLDLLEFVLDKPTDSACDNTGMRQKDNKTVIVIRRRH